MQHYAEIWSDDVMVAKIAGYSSVSAAVTIERACERYMGMTLHEYGTKQAERLGVKGPTQHVDTEIFDWTEPVTYWEIIKIVPGYGHVRVKTSDD